MSKSSSERNDSTNQTRDKDSRDTRASEPKTKLRAVHVPSSDKYVSDTEQIRPARKDIKLAWYPPNATGRDTRNWTLVKWDEIDAECKEICVIGKKGQTGNLVEVDGDLLYWRDLAEHEAEKEEMRSHQSYGAVEGDVRVVEDAPLHGEGVGGIKTTSSTGTMQIG